jgi:hypothetical protein
MVHGIIKSGESRLPSQELIAVGLIVLSLDVIASEQRLDLQRRQI